jgi:hypothetical protein
MVRRRAANMADALATEGSPRKNQLQRFSMRNLKKYFTEKVVIVLQQSRYRLVIVHEPFHASRGLSRNCRVGHIELMTLVNFEMSGGIKPRQSPLAAIHIFCLKPL